MQTGDLPRSAALNRVLVAAAIIFVAGIWWGWPGAFWAPDELDAGAVLRGARRYFSNGWFDGYPPLHYYVLTASYAPAFLLDALGVIDLTSGRVVDFLTLQGRFVSVAMAIGTLIGIAHLAHRLLGARFAWAAAFSAALFLPFPFYAKTVNLDVPYVFWFVWSLVFLIRAYDTARRRDIVAFAVTAALAIATKDQAYALYVLPSVHLAWTTVRRAGVGSFLIAFLSGLLVLAAIHNLPFNYDGFRGHIELITGPASQNYRMFANTIEGQWRLAVTTASLAAWALGVPGIALIAAALVGRPRRAGEEEQPSRVTPVLVGLALIPVSYYVTFIAAIGYIYDRFLLPLTMLAALPAGIGMARLLDGWPTRRVGRVAGLCLGVWLVWRAVSVDALLIVDSRYTTEAWLKANVPAEATVASVDQRGYLPRMPGIRYQQIRPTADETLTIRPDFIVVNTEFPSRYPPESRIRQWVRWLESENPTYEEVFRHKARLPWSAFAWHPKFQDTVEDPFTNLDKANPEIVVYKRRASVGVESARRSE